jgi:hypothetical protein
MAEQPLPGGGKRVTNRKKRRIPCTLWVGEREHSALVLDLSPSGLFIQTHARTQRGERLRLQLSHENTAIDLRIEVVRMKQVPPNLLAAAKGGIGVRIVEASPAYQALMNQLGIAERERARPSIDYAPEPEPEVEARSANGPRFRIHVAQIGGPRSRRLEVSAADAEAASASALEQLGDGWKVLRVETL